MLVLNQAFKEKKNFWINLSRSVDISVLIFSAGKAIFHFPEKK